MLTWYTGAKMFRRWSGVQVALIHYVDTTSLYVYLFFVYRMNISRCILWSDLDCVTSTFLLRWRLKPGWHFPSLNHPIWEEILIKCGLGGFTSIGVIRLVPTHVGQCENFHPDCSYLYHVSFNQSSSMLCCTFQSHKGLWSNTKDEDRLSTFAVELW